MNKPKLKTYAPAARRDFIRANACQAPTGKFMNPIETGLPVLK
jgi:hypothetical protein